MSYSSIELSLFASRIEAICEEMGAVLQRSAFSTNIKDRLDYSCAIFDATGALCSQAAHIPVHMGSMAYAMHDVVSQLSWAEGDMVILNDPFLGGTHLPDVTLIAPTFVDRQLVGFVVNRAHHADIGAEAPGSMPLSRSIEEEGIIIPPSYIVKAGQIQADVYQGITQQIATGDQITGDFAAQISANNTGIKRLERLVQNLSGIKYLDYLDALNLYAERIAKESLAKIPNGLYQFSDYLDDDGLGNEKLRIRATIAVTDDGIDVDFAGTAEQTQGNVNCPLSVAAAGVYYVFRCLMPNHTPNCDGSLRRIKISAPSGCLLNAERPAAVAAGNVETSTRIVDVIMGALAKALPEQIPAASHGSMNNLAMGAEANVGTGQSAWSCYETIGGGMGAGPAQPGQDAVQTHMTNTRNTPIEVMEIKYPVRINKYAIRQHSGGKGKHKGGNGIEREFEFTQPALVTLLTERRLAPPWGLCGGESGRTGENLLNNKRIAGKICFKAKVGDKLAIKTPGGGGWGTA